MWCTTGLRSWFPFPAPAASHELGLVGTRPELPRYGAHSLGLIPPMAILGFFFTLYSVIPLYCLFVGTGIAIEYAEYQYT